MSDLGTRIRDVLPCTVPFRTKDAIRAVLDLHRRIVADNNYLGQRIVYCDDCDHQWPCSTVRAIATALGVEVERG